MSDTNGQSGASEEHIGAMLDELAKREQESASAAFEDRVFMATRGVLRSSVASEGATDGTADAAQTLPTRPAQVLVHAKSARRFVVAFRVAAVVGLVVTAGVVWRALTPPPAMVVAPPVGEVAHVNEAELDELAWMLAMRDDAVAEEVHSISSEAERVSGSVSGSLGDFFGEALEG